MCCSLMRCQGKHQGSLAFACCRWQIKNFEPALVEQEPRELCLEETRTFKMRPLTEEETRSVFEKLAN